MAGVQDPIKDLMAELQAEEEIATRSGGKQPEPEPEDEPEPEETVEAKAEEPKPESKAEEPPKKGKADEARTVPAERFNEVSVKNRQLSKQVEEMAERLDRLENPEKYLETDEPSPEQARAQMRQEVRREIQREEFLVSGYEDYGQKTFDDACNLIASILPKGAGPGYVNMIIDAFEGNMKLASKAIKLLSEMQVPEIETFLNRPAAAQMVQLGGMARARAPRSEENGGGRRRARIEADDEAPAPLNPIRGNRGSVPEGLGDDVPDDVWFKRFDETILKPKPH